MKVDRQQRLQELWEIYKDKGIDYKDFKYLFNDGYLTGYEVAMQRQLGDRNA